MSSEPRASSDRGHEHHIRAAKRTALPRRVVLCSITGGAMARYLIRADETAATALPLLAELRPSQRTEFWSASIS